MEYKGTVEKKEEFSNKLQEKLDELLKKELKVRVEEVEYEKIGDYCGGKTPSYLPKDKKARIVSFFDDESMFGCPCGGTHGKNNPAYFQIICLNFYFFVISR